MIRRASFSDTHPVDDFDTARFQRLGYRWIDVFNRDTSVTAADFIEIGIDVGGKPLRGFIDIGAAIEEGMRPAGAKVIYLRHVVIAAIYNGWALLRYKQVDGWYMRLKQHVTAIIDRVAQADRVDQDTHRRVMQFQLLFEPRHAVTGHPLKIDLRHLLETGQITPVVV